jgi:hypothetical protein
MPVEEAVETVAGTVISVWRKRSWESHHPFERRLYDSFLTHFFFDTGGE